MDWSSGGCSSSGTAVFITLKSRALSPICRPPCSRAALQNSSISLRLHSDFTYRGETIATSARHTLQSLDERLVEDVVALELLVPPDGRFLAEPLRHTNRERPLQVRDPAFAAFHELDVVEVGVADERVGVEMHD